MFSLSLAAQDVVHLERYAERNAELPSNARGRVVIIGDSIVEGWSERAHPGFFHNTRFVARGISGEVTAQMLLRFRADVVALNPKTVVIMGGTNDIALNLGAYNEDYTFGNIVSMVEIARANRIKVVLTSVLPAAAYRWRPEVTDAPAKIASLNARIRAYAEANHIPYIDYWSALVAEDGVSMKSDYTSDGVHPLLAGYMVMEELLLQAVK